MDDRAPDSATFSGVFDQLADALREAEASAPPTTRDRRRSRPSFPELTVRMTRPPMPACPPPPRPIPAAPIHILVDAPRPQPRGDRSRDRATYAAPHRPSRPHFESRAGDVTTRRLARRRGASAPRGIGASGVIFFLAIAMSVVAVSLFALAYARLL